jgi:hypothetical protein
MDYNEKGCFLFAAHLIASAFPARKEKTEWVKKINRDFANSKMIQMFADCSENFEAEKLRKLILDRNK